MSLTSLKQTIQKNIVTVSIGTIPTVVTGLFAWAWPGALRKIVEVFLTMVSPAQLLAALCISLLGHAVLVAMLISSRSHDPKLIPRFGIYWDKDGNSYCPQCKTLTSQIGWATFNNSQWHGLRCTCTERAFVCLDAGQPLHVQDAMHMMKRV